MSWNLLIHNDGDPLGDIANVTRKLDGTFRRLEWISTTEAALPGEGGFRFEMTTVDGIVHDIYTHGGFYHLKQLAEVCEQEGWHMADAQEGEDIDLDDPQRWYEERSE